MTKKFDVVIGNPPYQDERIGDNESKTPPIYHHFMDAAFEVGDQAILITPARFLSNAGQTPKAWNSKTLADEHLRVAFYERDSSKVFPGPEIKGGVVVTHRDSRQTIGPIGTLAYMPEVQTILNAVQAKCEPSLNTIITEHPCKWTAQVFTDHPELKARIPEKSGTRLKTNTFKAMPEVCHESRPVDGHTYIQILGLTGQGRATRWVRSDYLIKPPVTHKHKVVLAAANGSGAFGEVLASPSVWGPEIGLTQTFIAIGEFDHEPEAEACLRYVSTKFLRALLGILKTTQHNPALKWQHVPVQDFTATSEIDWSKSIPEIDQQLYVKYGLDVDEIAFIEGNVKPME